MSFIAFHPRRCPELFVTPIACRPDCLLYYGERGFLLLCNARTTELVLRLDVERDELFTFWHEHADERLLFAMETLTRKLVCFDLVSGARLGTVLDVPSAHLDAFRVLAMLEHFDDGDYGDVIAAKRNRPYRRFTLLLGQINNRFQVKRDRTVIMPPDFFTEQTPFVVKIALDDGEPSASPTARSMRVVFALRPQAPALLLAALPSCRLRDEAALGLDLSRAESQQRCFSPDGRLMAALSRRNAWDDVHLLVVDQLSRTTILDMRRDEVIGAGSYMHRMQLLRWVTNALVAIIDAEWNLHVLSLPLRRRVYHLKSFCSTVQLAVEPSVEPGAAWVLLFGIRRAQRTPQDHPATEFGSYWVQRLNLADVVE